MKPTEPKSAEQRGVGINGGGIDIRPVGGVTIDWSTNADDSSLFLSVTTPDVTPYVHLKEWRRIGNGSIHDFAGNKAKFDVEIHVESSGANVRKMRLATAVKSNDDYPFDPTNSPDPARHFEPPTAFYVGSSRWIRVSYVLGGARSQFDLTW